MEFIIWSLWIGSSYLPESQPMVLTWEETMASAWEVIPLFHYHDTHLHNGIFCSDLHTMKITPFGSETRNAKKPVRARSFPYPACEERARRLRHPFAAFHLQHAFILYWQLPRSAFMLCPFTYLPPFYALYKPGLTLGNEKSSSLPPMLPAEW